MCSHKVISELFVKGKAVNLFPLKLIVLETKLDSAFAAQIFFSVPKKNIKKAVDRNTLKRRMKEAYRHNKSMLYDRLIANGKQVALVILYLSKEKLSYKEIEGKTISLLERLKNQL